MKTLKQIKDEFKNTLCVSSRKWDGKIYMNQEGGRTDGDRVWSFIESVIISALEAVELEEKEILYLWSRDSKSNMAEDYKDVPFDANCFEASKVYNQAIKEMKKRKEKFLNE